MIIPLIRMKIRKTKTISYFCLYE